MKNLETLEIITLLIDQIIKSTISREELSQMKLLIDRAFAESSQLQNN